jgi:hypothetical protein
LNLGQGLMLCSGLSEVRLGVRARMACQRVGRRIGGYGIVQLGACKGELHESCLGGQKAFGSRTAVRERSPGP